MTNIVVAIFLLIFSLHPAVSELQTASTENVNQCVEFSVQNGRIYYSNSYDHGYLYSVNIDGTDNHKMNDDCSTLFCVSDDRLFYENDSDGEKLYSIHIDGSNRRRLSDDCSASPFWNVTGGSIYYNGGEGDCLYRINTDGSGKTRLSDNGPLHINVSGNQVYYSILYRSGKENGIYRMNTDGTHVTKLTDDSPFSLTVYKDWLYYVNTDDAYKLYAMKTDGSDRHKLSDHSARNLNMAGGRIYYVDEDVGGGRISISSMKPDGSDNRQLSLDDANCLTVWGGHIYYMISSANIYSMNLDGTNKQLLLNVDKDAYDEVTYEVDASLHAGMPEYHFVARGKICKGNRNLSYVTGLNGCDENGHSILSADFSESTDDAVTGNDVSIEMMDTMGLHVADVNFDGYKDVIILKSFVGDGSNMWFDCWLWDPKTSSFIQSESFADICNPALDPDKKCICSSGSSGAASSWGGSIYRYIDGKFTMTNDLDTYKDGLTETKLLNGQMEVVRQINYSGEDRANRQSDAEKKYYKKSRLWQLDLPHWYWNGGHQSDKWLGG